MLISICYESINNSVLIFDTQVVLDLFFFFRQYNLTVFIKFFLIQSTNLNHKEGKQEEATVDSSTTISDSWGKDISCVVYPWDKVREARFSSGNYVCDISSERHSGVISRGILLGGNYFEDNFPGAII